MFTLKEYQILKKQGFDFKLSNDKHFVQVFKNNNYQDSIFNTNHYICFFGNLEFVRATGEEILNFFKTIDQLK